MPDGDTMCESCAKPCQGTRGGCGYCVACCNRWHASEIGQGPVIHAAEGQGQAGR